MAPPSQDDGDFWSGAGGGDAQIMLEVVFSGKDNKKQSGVCMEKARAQSSSAGHRRDQTRDVIAWEKSSSLGQDEGWGDALALEACIPACQSLPGPEKEKKEGPRGVFLTPNTPSLW